MLNFLGMTAAGWLGWWLGSFVGIVTAVVLSGILSGAGLFAAQWFAREYLD